jgi:hypothetical protein
MSVLSLRSSGEHYVSKEKDKRAENPANSGLEKNMHEVDNRIEWEQRIAMQYITTTTVQDTKRLQPYLAYKPIEVIRKTLERTTQLARLQQ